MTTESSQSLNFVTLKQGKIYTDLQKKIQDGSLERNEKMRMDVAKRGKKDKKKPIKERFENANTNINANYNIYPMINNSSQVQVAQNQIQRLEQLQSQFNTLMSQYQTLKQTMIQETKNYASTSFDTALGKNVYVNSVIENPTANYMGSFIDKTNSPSMTVLDNGDQTYSYETCLHAALSSGNTYFGLENVNPSTQLAQCNIGNNLDAARKYGQSTNGCSTGSDGLLYGRFNQNSTAIYETTGTKQIGCYLNYPIYPGVPSKGTIMTPSGINMDNNNFTNVFVLGSPGMSPWNNIGFPDQTAQWIWYTMNAQHGAPVNIGSPVTFIQEFNNPNNTYTNATLTAINDDQGIWYINSQKVGTSNGGWGGSGNQMSITLNPGTNYIQCEATNYMGPAGMLATVIANGNVLCNTNGKWKFTNIPVANMALNASNYSVATCQKYAQENGYVYFGLQNGSVGTSQCVVGNSLSAATQYGVSSPTQILKDNKTYGVLTNNAVYQINSQGANPAFVGKVGYVDSSFNVYEYPESMIQAASSQDAVPSIIGASSSCEQTPMPIDSIQWGKYTNTGKMMSGSSQCGLSASISDTQTQMNILQGKLATIADEMITIIQQLKRNQEGINKTLNINGDELSKNLDIYNQISMEFGQYKNMNNMGLMLQDSKNLVMHENYQYIFWGVLAMTVVVIAASQIMRR